MKTRKHLLYATTCADCGLDGPFSYSLDGAQRKARDQGWADERGKTLCPECRKKVKA